MNSNSANGKPVKSKTVGVEDSPDAGYATIAAAGIIVAVTAVLLAVAGIAQHVIASHRAQVAADMGAVAGAWAHAMGRDACEAAEQVVGRNQATLVRCVVLGNDVQVHAKVRISTARSQAGPV